jgi:hypothetical protein
MPNPSNEEIKRKIVNLQDKIYDAKHYILSSSCEVCQKMYEDIKKYEAEIAVLKELYQND